MAFDDWDDDWWYRFPRRSTKKVEGGIKARAARFGESWWSAKWLEGIASRSSNRLARGRTYARKGQIMDFAVGANRITGRVQGSFDDPYEVIIKTQPMPQMLMGNIAAEIKSRPVYAARFLNQEMPRELEDVFEKQGASLFPSRADFNNRCSCPDSADPCKHIAALFYLFSLELERDPFLLLSFHGFDRAAMLSQFPQVVLDSGWKPKSPNEPLPENYREFWRAFRVPPDPPSVPPKENALLVKQLGSFPLWRGESDLMEALQKIYAAAGRKAAKNIES